MASQFAVSDAAETPAELTADVAVHGEDSAQSFDAEGYLGDIPTEMKISMETETVHMPVEPQHEMMDHARSGSCDRGLFSPAFDGHEVTFSLREPPVPLALQRAAAGSSAVVAPPAAVRPQQ